jgi:hypothetical protein
MLSFFAVRGIKPEYILSLSPIEKRFYYESMGLWYKDINNILEILIKLLGGVRRG